MLDQENLGHAGHAGRSLGHRPRVLAGDEDVDIATDPAGRRDGGQGGLVEALAVVLGENENGHQTIPTSCLSFATSSSTEPSLTPAWRRGGSSTFT
mgnify:CR=1 FL=1